MRKRTPKWFMLMVGILVVAFFALPNAADTKTVSPLFTVMKPGNHSIFTDMAFNVYLRYSHSGSVSDFDPFCFKLT